MNGLRETAKLDALVEELQNEQNVKKVIHEPASLNRSTPIMHAVDGKVKSIKPNDGYESRYLTRDEAVEVIKILFEDEHQEVQEGSLRDCIKNENWSQVFSLLGVDVQDEKCYMTDEISPISRWQVSGLVLHSLIQLRLQKEAGAVEPGDGPPLVVALIAENVERVLGHKRYPVVCQGCGRTCLGETGKTYTNDEIKAGCGCTHRTTRLIRAILSHLRVFTTGSPFHPKRCEGCGESTLIHHRKRRADRSTLTMQESRSGRQQRRFILAWLLSTQMMTQM